jgi:hypothetical protein
MIAHPPQLNGYELRHSCALRFVSSSAFAGNITYQNLLDTILLATSATAVYDAFLAVKIRRIRLWAVPVIGNATTVTVIFSGATIGLVGDQQVHTDTSMGIQPASVSARPSRRSLASDFQLSSANTAFQVECPSGTVIDVELTFRGAYGVPVLAQNVAVGALTGGVYLRGLDGLAVATTKFPVITSEPTV